jgi:hypothetical protein
MRSKREAVPGRDAGPRIARSDASVSEEPMEDQEGTTMPTIPEEISELLARRTRYREWLTKLERRAGDVRPAVAERVREDYLGRLADVEEELADHRDGLEDSLMQRRSRTEELEQERDDLSAQLEEAELRHAVGEFTAEEWESRSGEHRGALEELEGRLSEEAEAADRLEEVLAELDAPAAGATSEPPPVELAGPGEELEEEEGEEDVPSGVAEGAGGWGARPMPEPTLGGEVPEAPEAVELSDDEPAAEAQVAEEGDEAATEAQVAEEDEDDVLAFLGERRGPEGETSAQEEESASEEGGGFEDELDFLESLSLEDPDSLDTLSLVLDEGEEEAAEEDEDRGGNGAA